MTVRVWTGVKLFPKADYNIDSDVVVGEVVLIPFRKKEIFGVVIEINPNDSFCKLKTALSSNFRLCPKLVDFIREFSRISLNDVSSSLITNLKLFSSKVKPFSSNYSLPNKPRFLEENQGNLGENQGNLGENQGDLEENQGNLGENQGNLGENQGNLGKNQENLGENQENLEKNQENLGKNQGDLEENQENLGKNQENLGENQGDLGKNQENLGENQENLGKNPRKLSEEQVQAVNNIVLGTNLLWGVTGSGKTEVFFVKIQEVLNQGKQVLVLLPEIALTESMIERFRDNLGLEPLVWNSQSKNKSKFMGIFSGEAKVILGSRSAIFLPFKQLGLIIVDEEHDNSFKQSVFPIYNGRDGAVLRALIEKIPLILASATPSLESFQRCKENKYNLLKLSKRFSQLKTPKITFVINEGGSLISKKILTKVEEHLHKKQQIIFFVNRRGFGSIIICENCYQRMVCEKCGFFLTLHKHSKTLLCHNCNSKYSGENCYNCQEKSSFSVYGIGVEKVAEHLKLKFPQNNIKIFSSDICDNKSKIKEFLKDVNDANTDIVVGTQMISKGHNFKSVALVVILGFNNSAFNIKSNEQTLQTLIQTSGRAGRGSLESEVILQTEKYMDEKLMGFFLSQNYYDFLNYEIDYRRKWNLSPFVKLVVLKYSHYNDKECVKKLNETKKSLQKIFIFISDPVFIKKEKHYFYQLLGKISRENFLKFNTFLSQSITKEIVVDVDPSGGF